MRKEESYDVRLEMAEMHDKFQERLRKAMEDENYVEASWLCYAIFEQRITRLIQKHIAKCPRQSRGNNKPPIGIKTKIECLKKLCKVKYGAYADFDRKLLGDITGWCEQRDNLIHGLVSLEHYKKYDKEFKTLAESGVPLVDRLYDEATQVREWSRSNKFEKFPDIKCRCKNSRCIVEK